MCNITTKRRNPNSKPIEKPIQEPEVRIPQPGDPDYVVEPPVEADTEAEPIEEIKERVEEAKGHDRCYYCL